MTTNNKKSSDFNWFKWFKSKKTSQYDVNGIPSPQSINSKQLRDTRFVVLDLETTGLNIHKDQLIAIGAVVIENNEIQLSQSFERTIFRTLKNIDNTVLIHGISPEDVAKGEPPEQALLDFMDYAGESIFLAYHAPFDQAILSRSLKRDLGFALKHRFFDVADIAPALLPTSELGRSMKNVGLDDWVNHFGLNVSNRHNASADALATAEIMLILLREAEKQSINTLSELAEKIKNYKKLQQMRN
jgi:DNA polymerase-3 subunit epsilon